MKNRCTNQKYEGFSRYGGRGISYDQSWETFENFLRDMGQPPPGMSLDRIDNDRGYCADNCRWATPTQQTRNRGIAKTVEINGEIVALAEAAKMLGISYSALHHRVERGRPLA